MTSLHEAVKRGPHPSLDQLTISFEVFPPRDKSSEDRLLRNVRSLEGLSPRFVSVTYGAGGSTQENTRATAARIAAETLITPAAHLTCIDASQEQVDAVARGCGIAGAKAVQKASGFCEIGAF